MKKKKISVHNFFFFLTNIDNKKKKNWEGILSPNNQRIKGNKPTKDQWIKELTQTENYK